MLFFFYKVDREKQNDYYICDVTANRRRWHEFHSANGSITGNLPHAIDKYHNENPHVIVLGNNGGDIMFIACYHVYKCIK